MRFLFPGLLFKGFLFLVLRHCLFSIFGNRWCILSPVWGASSSWKAFEVLDEAVWTPPAGRTGTFHPTPFCYPRGCKSWRKCISKNVILANDRKGYMDVNCPCWNNGHWSVLYLWIGMICILCKEANCPTPLMLKAMIVIAFRSFQSPCDFKLFLLYLYWLMVPFGSYKKILVSPVCVLFGWGWTEC